MSHAATSPSPVGVVAFLLYVGFLTSIWIALSYQHGEAPRWRWGEDTEEQDGG